MSRTLGRPNVAWERWAAFVFFLRKGVGGCYAEDAHDPPRKFDVNMSCPGLHASFPRIQVRFQAASWRCVSGARPRDAATMGVDPVVFGLVGPTGPLPCSH